MLAIHKPKVNRVSCLKVGKLPGTLLKMPRPKPYSMAETRTSRYSFAVVMPPEPAAFPNSVVHLGIRIASSHPFAVWISFWDRLLDVLVATYIVRLLVSRTRVKYDTGGAFCEACSVNIGAILFFIYYDFDSNTPAIDLIKRVADLQICLSTCRLKWCHIVAEKPNAHRSS